MSSRGGGKIVTDGAWEVGVDFLEVRFMMSLNDGEGTE